VRGSITFINLPTRFVLSDLDSLACTFIYGCQYLGLYNVEWLDGSWVMNRKGRERSGRFHYRNYIPAPPVYHPETLPLDPVCSVSPCPDKKDRQIEVS